MYRQTIFIGRRAIPTLLVRENHFGLPPSRAWCCPHCGEIWARAVVEMPGGEMRKFLFLTHPCEEHSDPLLPSLMVSGSLLSAEPEFNDSLPRELWEREFHLHDAFIRKNQHDDSLAA